MLGLFAALGLLVLPTTVEAQIPDVEARDREARTQFEAGKVAFTEGRYENALQCFERSFELSRRPALQYNLGLAYDRLRRDGEALDAFEAYLEWDPNGERSIEVRARVAALRQAIASRMAVAEPRSDSPERTTRPRDAAPPDEEHRGGKRRWWILGASVVAIAAAGVTVGLLLGRSEGEQRREPNTGVRVEALSWR